MSWAYEIHVPNAHLYAAYSALREAGKAHGMHLFGSRAVESMRMEKGYLHWKSDILTEFDPFETGVDRFVKLDKGDFIGREALVARHSAGPRKRLITLALGCDHAPAHPGCLGHGGGRGLSALSPQAIGGHRTGLNLAYAFVDPAHAASATPVEVDMMGDMIPARVIPPSPYAPHNG